MDLPQSDSHSLCKCLRSEIFKTPELRVFKSEDFSQLKSARPKAPVVLLCYDLRMDHRRVKTFNKNDYLFLWHKFRIYGVLALLLVGPTMYFTHSFGETAAIFLSWITNIFILHRFICSDNPGDIRDQAYFIMRRRHFGKISETKDF